MTPDACSVLVTDGPQLPVQQLGQVVKDCLAATRIDANQAARRCGMPGILAEGVSRTAARALAGRLADVGVTARVVNGALPAPRPAPPLHQLRLEDDRLIACDTAGRPTDALPIERLRLLHVGAFGLEAKRSLEMETPEGMLIRGGYVRPSVKMTSRRADPVASVEAWLYADGPPVVWRLPQDGINYRQLLGHRTQPEPAASFRLLLEVLRQKAPQMAVTAAYTGFVLRHKTDAHRYDTIDDFERAGRAWLVHTLLGRAGGGAR